MSHVQLDFFSSPDQLDILSRLVSLEQSLGKTRRSLFSRINELEKELLDLRKEQEARGTLVLVNQEEKI